MAFPCIQQTVEREGVTDGWGRGLWNDKEKLTRREEEANMSVQVFIRPGGKKVTPLESYLKKAYLSWKSSHRLTAERVCVLLR